MKQQGKQQNGLFNELEAAAAALKIRDVFLFTQNLYNCEEVIFFPPIRMDTFLQLLSAYKSVYTGGSTTHTRNIF